MTVCIAGIHEDRLGQASIFLVCDRRISLFSGSFSHDGNAKYQLVHHDWIGMFAGSVEETNLMLREINKSLLGLKSVPFEKVVDCCRETYVRVRKRLIETEILPEFDIPTYSKFKQLKKTDEALYLTIQEKITREQENWNLLFAGFDDERKAHLFVISGPGRVEYCDAQKYAAIGLGALAALIWMSFYGYKPLGRAAECLYAAMSAKFFAEKASDVGQTTVVTVFKSTINALMHVITDEEILTMRKAWEAIPKHCDKSVNGLVAKMTELDEILKQIGQSAFQKSAQAK